jgi:hypothetical protein
MNINNIKEANLKKQNIEFLISKQNKNHYELISKKLTAAATPDVNNNHHHANTPITSNHNYSASFSNMNKGEDTESSEFMKRNPGIQSRKSSFFKSDEILRLRNTKINQGALQGLNIFHRKYQSGYIDVWWLYDDGGLTILLPYLLMKRKCWGKCKLRVFIQTKNPNTNISEEQRNMATLLSKFRIEFDDLIVFCTLNKKPSTARYN